MITFDGDRSKRRTWYGEKQIRTMTDSGVESKVTSWDGFTFKLWQRDDLSGGRVSAPMGVAVLCSSINGIRISVADNWLGGFSSNSILHTLLYATTTPVLNKVFLRPTEEQMVEDGNQVVPYKPMGFLSPYYMLDGTTLTDESIWVRDSTAFPGIMPYKGAEGFLVTTSENMFIDLNGNGTADYPKYIIESQLLFYQAAGKNLGGRSCFDQQSAQQTNQPWRTIQHITPTSKVIFHNVEYYASGVNAIFTTDFDYPSVGHTLLSDLIPAGSIPDTLRGLIAVPTGLTGARPCGSYCFGLNGTRISFHCVDATNTVIPQASAIAAYFTDNPSEVRWKLFYILRVGDTSHVISSDNFVNLLDGLATVDLSLVPPPYDWNNVRRMMSQLTLAYPNVTWNVPYDSIMFHTHSGTVITWTRKYGAVEFTPTGMIQPSITVPVEVQNTPGVRPVIQYAGTFAEEPLYTCICDQVGVSGKGFADLNPGSGADTNAPVTFDFVQKRVQAIYFGSPFTTWTKLPGTVEGDILVYAKPVKITPSEKFFIGVIRSTVLVDNVETQKYFFAFLFVNLVNIAEATWRRMGMLPFTVEEIYQDNFDLCLFGDDSMVNSLYNFPSPSPIVPQFPVGPYNSYAGGQP